MNRVWGVFGAAGIAAIIGVYAFTGSTSGGGGGGGGGATTAHLFVSTSGNDTTCTRNASLVTYTTATSSGNVCATFDKAFSLANVGDSVLVETGVYPAQTISFHSKTTTGGCNDGTYAGGWTDADTSACVTFQPDSGATPSVGAIAHTTANWTVADPSAPTTISVDSTAGFNVANPIFVQSYYGGTPGDHEITIDCTGMTSTTFTGCADDPTDASVTTTWNWTGAKLGAPMTLYQDGGVNPCGEVCGLRIESPYIAWDGIPVASRISLQPASSSAACVHDVLIENTQADFPVPYGSDRIGLINDTFGDSAFKEPQWTGQTCGGSFTTNTNISMRGTFWGNFWQDSWTDNHGQTYGCCGKGNTHMACIQIPGTNSSGQYYDDGIRFDQDTFWNCAVEDLLWSDNTSSNPYNFKDVLVQNSYFDAPRVNLGAPGGSYAWSIDSGPNMTWRFNTAQGQTAVCPSAAAGFNGTDCTSSSVYGNIMSSYAHANCPANGGSEDYDVIASASGGLCGVHDVNAGGQIVGGGPPPNPHLASCSVAAANLVPTTVTGGIPAFDFYGTARPVGANADAGAVEDC